MNLPPLVGVLGVARAGKDTFADVLVQDHGYVRYAFGDTIKAYFAPFIGGIEDHTDLLDRMAGDAPLDSEEALRFKHEVLIPYSLTGRCLNAFTELTEDKDRFRDILNLGGELMYDFLLRSYIAGLEEMLSGGVRVVNPRVGYHTGRGYSGEAQVLFELGAAFVAVERPDGPMPNLWDQAALSGLYRQLGAPNLTIMNLASSGEAFADHCRDILSAEPIPKFYPALLQYGH